MSKKEQKKTSIGGQAVIEGVMMRGESSMATAVRDADGIIRVESKRVTPAKKRSLFFRLPIIRGVYSFVNSFIDGTKILTRSAEVFGDGEPSKFEKWMAKKLKIDVMSIVIALALVIGLGLAVFLFMWLPQFVRGLLETWCNIEFNVWAKNFIEGGLKLFIFVGYILLTSLLKDIRRTFMYHGAEHKTISCYESGLELTVENAKKCSRVHNRCGTTFMVFVILISILTFAVFESLAGAPLLAALGKGAVYNVVRVLCKIALLPIVAGLSYELLRALAKTDCWIFYPIKLPGLLLQRVTTREPDDGMLEVAITAFNTVAKMDADPTIPEKKFVVSKKRKDVLADVAEKLKANGIDEIAEAEWIVSITLGVKRDQVNTEDFVSPKEIDEINKIVDERITGRPLWYCIGDTEFYGYKIKVDERVLIPRMETELLVETALKHVDETKTVLDLCTGSGAIAVAVKKQSNAAVTAVDVSADALSVANENAKLNGVEIEFIESDAFNGLTDRKFDVIISNPPYIKTEEIEGLQVEVKNFEPKLALDGGTDGLDFYRLIANEAKNYLNEGGILLLECGYDQAQTVAQLLSGYSQVEIIKDLENIERIVKAVL